MESDRSGYRLTEVSDELLKNIVEADPRQSICIIAKELDIHNSIVVLHRNLIGKEEKYNTKGPHEWN